MSPHRRRPAPPLRLALVLVLLAGLVPATARAAAASVVPSPTVTAERLGGTDRYATAVAVSQRLFPSGPAPVVYLVAGTDYPDALAAGPIAARQGGVVLLTLRDAIPPTVEQELIRLAPGRVIVAGGSGVIRDAVLWRVRAILAPTTLVWRVAGPDRYGTAAALSTGSFAAGDADVVFVASGAGFPDALAAAAAAAAVDAPVLLTAPAFLPAATAAELDRLNPGRIVIVGGPSAVSAAVADAVRRYAPTVERLAGPDRYGTAAAIADRFLPDATAVIIATAGTFADALAAAPLARALGSPLLLVLPELVPIQTRDALRSRAPTHLVALGGPAAVGEITLGEIVGWADGRLAVPPPGPTYRGFDGLYHDYGEMVTYIRAAELAFPSILRVFSIGKSHQGRDIWAAKISDNVELDEDEPEVLFDALHHGREHLTVEQGLHVLKTLVTGYGTDATVTRLVDEREVVVIFALNPDGWAYDLTGSPYVGWRKNRQPNAGTTAIGTDPNRNYGYRWGCCGGSSGSPSAWDYRGPAPWSSPETRALRDFVESRVIGGEQQIRTHVTFHTNGELILYPFGYTKTDIPSDMTPDDHATFVAMARKMASLNGYRAQQSSDLYITDGDQIDWMYAVHGIFSFTFELYPTEQVSSHADHEPPDEVIAAQTARNRGALLYLIDMAGCPYAAIGMAGAYC
ncbi:MAG TPA: M14 family zinc carboxypeptidase [Candidatus Limnocylindrales bacterium]|nr:M14 family zinc carboxypeptidase [Candidatus Limnocylindrales bacterium]